MQIRLILQWTTILVFFIIALVMELAPWPTGFQAFNLGTDLLDARHSEQSQYRYRLFARRHLGFTARFHARHPRPSIIRGVLFHCEKLFGTA